MNYKKLGNSGLELSEIAFGAWAAGGWQWGGTERKDAVEAIKASYELGVTSIDTAPVYGQGRSEEIVAEAIKDIPRDNVQLLTKFGLQWEGTKGEFFFSSNDNDGKVIDIYKYASRERIIKECEDSLRRLGTDYIDLYQIHWPDATTPIVESMEAVARLIEQGKVRFAGVSNYNAEQMHEAEMHVKLASNQMPYSMLKRNIEEEVVPYCIKNNIGILAYSPLQRGLLTGKIKPGHTFSEGDSRAGGTLFTEVNLKAINTFLDRIKPLAEEKNASLGQLVLRWTLEQPGITIALAGARNAEQSIQNAKASDVKLNVEELDFISGHLGELMLVVG